MPQGTLGPGSAVYKGKLYCFGGAAGWLVQRPQQRADLSAVGAE